MSRRRRAALAIALAGVLALALASLADEHSRSCIPATECCRICDRGKACGNSCISRSYTCHKGRGCACDREEVCR